MAIQESETPTLAVCANRQRKRPRIAASPFGLLAMTPPSPGADSELFRELPSCRRRCPLHHPSGGPPPPFRFASRGRRRRRRRSPPLRSPGSDPGRGGGPCRSPSTDGRPDGRPMAWWRGRAATYVGSCGWIPQPPAAGPALCGGVWRARPAGAGVGARAAEKPGVKRAFSEACEGISRRNPSPPTGGLAHSSRVRRARPAGASESARAAEKPGVNRVFSGACAGNSGRMHLPGRAPFPPSSRGARRATWRSRGRLGRRLGRPTG